MQLDEYLSQSPPRCLRELRPRSVSVTGDTALWLLVCGCGSDEGGILGYPLGDLKPGFEGHPFLVSPFTFRCVTCERETGFLDTAEDGEGAEFDKAEDGIGCVAYRGEGEPIQAECPNCGVSRVKATVTLTYHDERIHDWEDDPAFPLADYFNWFRLDCICPVCGHSWEVTTIDTK